MGDQSGERECGKGGESESETIMRGEPVLHSSLIYREVVSHGFPGEQKEKKSGSNGRSLMMRHSRDCFVIQATVMYQSAYVKTLNE